MRSLVVRGVNCTQMENMAVAATQHPEDTLVGQFLRKELAAMLEANRRYLKKRGTKRLVQLLGNSFWKAPLRSALIFEVLNDRAFNAKVRSRSAAKALAASA
jgi:hypothetical protein